MTSASASLILRKPAIAPLTLADGLRRNFRGWLVQEKSDGRHEFLAHDGSVFNGERMASGELIINDVVVSAGLTARGMLREAKPDTDTPESWRVSQ